MDPQYFKDIISSEKITQLLSSSSSTKQILNILKIKQLITKSSDVEFNVKRLFCNVISCDVEDFCSILKLVKIAPNEKIDFLNKIRNFVRQENCPEEIMYQLKLLNTLLEIETDMNKNLSDQIINTFKYLVGKNLYLNLENIEINRYICNYILPKFLKESNDSAATSTICELAQKFDNLDIICSNYKYVLNDDQLISIKEEFHKFIQDSLGSGNSRKTKNAIFIIRQMMESKGIIKLYGPTEQLESFLQLIEVSAEKQLHLIKPSMHLFSKINDLHNSWKIIVYSIYLRHPHLAVITETVQIILLQYWYLENIVIFTEFLPEILQALNKMKLIASTIENFKLKVVTTVNDEMMSILFEESTKIAWKPVQFYYIFHILLENMKLTPTVISKILKLLKTIPDRTIRNLFMDQFLSPTLSNDENLNTWVKDHTEDFLTLIFNVFVYYYECYNSFLFIKYDSEYVSEYVYEFEYEIEILPQLLKTLESADYLNGLIEYHCNSTNELNVIFICYLYYHSDKFRSIQFPNNFYLKYYKEDFKILGDHLCTLKLIQSDENWWMRKKINYYSYYYRYSYSFEDILYGKSKYSIELQQSALQLYAHNYRNYKPNDYEDVLLIKWIDLFLKEGSTIDCKTCSAIISIFKQSYTTRIQPDKIVAMFDKICDTQSPSLILQYLQSFLLCNLDTDMLEDKLINLIQVLVEMKKSRYMIEAVECFLQINFNYSESLLHGVRKLSELSDEYPMIAYTILNNFHWNKNSQLMGELANILLNLMVDKKILAKDERTMFELVINPLNLNKRTLYEDGSFETLYDNKYIKKSIFILTGMPSITRMLLNDNDTKQLLQFIFVKYYKNFMKRYYADSQIHMEKLRLFQILLLLSPADVIEIEMILTFAFDVIQESNQTSVKHLLQLLIINSLNKLNNANFAKWFGKLCVLFKSKDSDNSTILTLIPIVYHLIKLKKELELCETITAILLPLTMGPQFKLRLYAQQTICWIYEFTQTNLTIPQNNYANKYEALYDGINCVLLQTEIKDSATKSDFHFMRTFSMEEDFSMHTILVDIPRLNGVSIYEWKMYQFELDSKFSIGESYGYIKVLSIDSPFNLKVVEDNYLTGATESAVSEQSVIIQKKITTGKDKKPINAGKLIVVTSLIESRANIGGLSRTSDIFGVDTLVVNDGKVSGTQDFRNLSMSSEKWVNMLEVKVNVLKEYLLQAKLDGFTIVGAEQTSGSKMLDQYRFEEKTVLLLGNEKSGIPADLINLLDVCVEIPQFGVVRSLNVHVAGALFIWEYTKQQQNTIKLE